MAERALDSVIGHFTVVSGSAVTGIAGHPIVTIAADTGGRGGHTWQVHCEFVESF